jgi:hypothetical protein
MCGQDENRIEKGESERQKDRKITWKIVFVYPRVDSFIWS